MLYYNKEAGGMKISKKIKSHGIITIIGLMTCYSLYSLFFNTTVKPKTTSDFSKTSVMITREDGRSGGTGVIISSKRNESKILTNAHVCAVVKNGGIVRSDLKKALVKYYQVSNVHDLCLITVNSNFRVNTILAKEEPEIYEDAIVSGHPHLLPNIVTYGHFSGHELITIMTGFRECTDQEKESEDTGLICALFGGIPEIKTFEAQAISATIQPGSSGSAVFNKEGELSGLVFAGSGDFGFGFIVPYEYVVSFFEIELPHLIEKLPDPMNKPSIEASRKDWKNKCLQNLHDANVQKVCELFNQRLILNN